MPNTKNANPVDSVEKLATGIEGFDLIAAGGIPLGRSTLVSGTAGSAKTIFAAQFLAKGIQYNQPGVFVTFEESPADITKNIKSLGWDVKTWEKEGKWLFVDASPDPEQEVIISGDFDFGGLMSRIEYAARKINAARIALDSIGALFNQFSDSAVIRRELFRLSAGIKGMGITTVMTAERNNDYGRLSRYGVEEFVTDNVILLRNVLEVEKRRRTLEILKFRGADHQKGEYPFTITPDAGIEILPLSAMELKQKSTEKRIPSGNCDLDKMCGGGFFRDSVTLVSGATGTGKTMLMTGFAHAVRARKERCLILAFEESREQLARNASGWGVDFEEMEKEGCLKIVCEYPEVRGLDERLIRIKRIVNEFRPDRIAVDSLSALERVSSLKGFREFVIGLTSFIKHGEIAGLFTSTTPSLLGGTSVTEAHISTITDSIILLRYVEIGGEMRRGLTVLKMRGSNHIKDIVEYTIGKTGMEVGKAFRNVTGILSGHPVQTAPGEVERISGMFDT